jgi:hypothetical protein
MIQRLLNEILQLIRMQISGIRLNKTRLRAVEAGYYLSRNLLAMACGVVVSTCMGDGGPTLCNIIGMDIDSIDGL